MHRPVPGDRVAGLVGDRLAVGDPGVAAGEESGEESGGETAQEHGRSDHGGGS